MGSACPEQGLTKEGMRNSLCEFNLLNLQSLKTINLNDYSFSAGDGPRTRITICLRDKARNETKRETLEFDANLKKKTTCYYKQ